MVRFQVGLDSDGGLTNAGGDIPDIRLFNEVGEFLGGRYDPGYIEDGTTGSDVKVTQKSEQQTTYALFSANDDAVCLAYISIVWPDEQKHGWLGSWGRQLCHHIWQAVLATLVELNLSTTRISSLTAKSPSVCGSTKTKINRSLVSKSTSLILSSQPKMHLSTMPPSESMPSSTYTRTHDEV